MKRIIPKNHCIRVVTWKNDNYDLYNYEGYKNGMSAMSTGATSLSKAFKIIKENLKTGHTHFLISYPIANSGITDNENFDIYSMQRMECTQKNKE